MEHAYYYQTGQTRTYQEMRQKPVPRETFFNLKHEPRSLRPESVATEFVDTDWDEDDIISEPEDNSPRLSLQSSGQPSITTVSSYDEVQTPRSSRSRDAYFTLPSKQVEGPRGPHLFRGSTGTSLNEELILSLSPVTPKVPNGRIGPLLWQTPLPSALRKSSPFQYSREELDRSKLASWTPEMVAQSMLNAGIETSMADRFIENDINGAILITLKFEDLRELDIASFGIRTKVWHQIQALRDNLAAAPRAPTPIEDAPSREARRDARQKSKDDAESRRRQGSQRRGRRKPTNEDVITPMESVSIIGIEQVIPKPHHCSKGENCSKWRKQQRLLEEFRRANPNVEIKAGGTLMIVGDAGNPETARAINPNELARPVSDAVPSVVASSDVMGPGDLPPLRYLQETTLRNLQLRDPQDNVRQFLDFQTRVGSEEVPPTPPYEINPPAQAPHQGLRRLPRLSIPENPRPHRPTAPARASTAPPSAYEQQQHMAQQRSQQQSPQRVQQSPQRVQQHVQQPIQPQQQEFVPYVMDKADPLSPDLETPRNPWRTGTPFSEMDVPVTAVPLGPVSRDNSQSVPPDMNYHMPVTGSGLSRTQSRASARRPSFPVLPVLDENKPVRVTSRLPAQAMTSPRASVRPQQAPTTPVQAPGRVNYPWSPVERTNWEQTIPPAPKVTQDDSSTSTMYADGISFQGPMKKRKTKLLRHEWQDGYFTLKGTRLNMHKDAERLDRTLEYVDIDDYAIACSSLASTSKLSAALKAVHLSHSREKSDPVAAFSFQLVPQDKNGARLRKRDSAIHSNGVPAEGVNGTGKTHHFAVKSRDDRIDWMRELMLAKALKQKGEGFEISVNGNMI
ncbi:hypothetical protein B0I35DRAFT_27540 [Stachybotrys elegans]|uniref:PH domain-containing protein n=1 Tax=Stachybotrys elegans TaxID=80388 RepID=A0A8K0WWL5_9HYPO|nr:hypothetical protein B0I35DRAFT_27540 [Stachybotrys elegans]